MAIECTDKTV